MTRRNTGKRADGFSLLEVMITVAVLSFALLALAALQVRLTKNSADAKSRGTATTLGQAQIEEFRAIEQLDTETGIEAFDDIITGGLGDDSVFGTGASNGAPI